MPEKCFYSEEAIDCPYAGQDFVISPCPSCPNSQSSPELDYPEIEKITLNKSV